MKGEFIGRVTHAAVGARLVCAAQGARGAGWGPSGRGCVRSEFTSHVLATRPFLAETG